MHRDKEIRALTAIARVESLADSLMASDMTCPQIRRLLVSVTAYLDSDELHAGVVPHMVELRDGSVPAPVLEAVRLVLVDAVAAAIAHRIPKGRPN